MLHTHVPGSSYLRNNIKKELQYQNIISSFYCAPLTTQSEVSIPSLVSGIALELANTSVKG